MTAMAEGAVRPDPAVEIRMTTLHATRGANFWSTRPVMRLDLVVGAYEDISSADVPGFIGAQIVGGIVGVALLRLFAKREATA